jgi:hypothetical protein
MASSEHDEPQDRRKLDEQKRARPGKRHDVVPGALKPVGSLTILKEDLEKLV